MRLTGTEDVRKAVKEVAKKYPQAMAAAIYKLGVAILSDSLPRVPREFGVLRASGYVAPPTGQGLNADVQLGYGTVYAVPQHERLDYRHPRGGEAKYLENAINAVAPSALPKLAKWAQEIAEAGGRWGATSGIPTRPVVGNSNRKSSSQSKRLTRAGRNVRGRTGR